MSGITPVAAGAFALYQFLRNSSQKSRETRQTSDDRRAELLAKENAAAFDRYSADLKACREELDETEHDRNVGWDLARRWHGKAWRMKHQAIHARQLCESMARLSGNPLPNWEDDLDLPLFDPDKKP